MDTLTVCYRISLTHQIKIWLNSSLNGALFSSILKFASAKKNKPEEIRTPIRRCVESLVTLIILENQVEMGKKTCRSNCQINLQWERPNDKRNCHSSVYTARSVGPVGEETQWKKSSRPTKKHDAWTIKILGSTFQQVYSRLYKNAPTAGWTRGSVARQKIPSKWYVKNW